ncbi:metallopeptidase, family M24 [Roseibium aggregatum IAM 12614]|uniref:Metallopeptidase, family M24 n=1 Tax=Roseibium aggregatum (strain ATCC 25650 / DSM 13394 / JCM 20685 / NBRC 16684 / NCIMB 2208 / IAM 12614 / B1) TaxID=384765 RepID=A0NYX3_ROSAI|nr:Xaa-Pro peptidase family protein [Roseibium aggregatum]EAV41974.1 metallopeptidase, family M24 [Roseibium aggregatum IAM 12614]
MSEPDFPEDEFAARTHAAQTAMRVQDFDALFFTTEAEMRYFTGFRTLFWQSPTRSWFLVVPVDGKPIAVIPQIGAHLMASTWIDDIRTFSAPHPVDDGINLLADTLRAFAKIAMPMGRESALRMPLRDFQRLRDLTSGAEYLDGTELVQSLRMVKSDREIALLREICGIGSAAFARAPELFHADQPLSEVFRSFRIELLRQGADDVPYLVGGAGQGGYGDVISPPSTRPLQEGDVLMLDTGATRNGYFCDFDRNFAIGRASEVVRSAHETLVRAVEAAAAIARPGRTCADLFRAMAEVLGEGEGDVGRLGHGLGMQLTEAPSLTGFDETLLRENMVLTLEPSLSLGPGRMMVHEENIVIRDGAPEFLTVRAAPDIPVITS